VNPLACRAEALEPTITNLPVTVMSNSQVRWEPDEIEAARAIAGFTVMAPPARLRPGD
jgi:hypothetical protein